MEEKVNSVIKSWTFFSKGLSFIGRVFVVNSLCASKFTNICIMIVIVVSGLQLYF